MALGRRSVELLFFPGFKPVTYLSLLTSVSGLSCLFIIDPMDYDSRFVQVAKLTVICVLPILFTASVTYVTGRLGITGVSIKAAAFHGALDQAMTAGLLALSFYLFD